MILECKLYMSIKYNLKFWNIAPWWCSAEGCFPDTMMWVVYRALLCWMLKCNQQSCFLSTWLSSVQDVGYCVHCRSVGAVSKLEWVCSAGNGEDNTLQQPSKHLHDHWCNRLLAIQAWGLVLGHRDDREFFWNVERLCQTVPGTC